MTTVSASLLSSRTYFFLALFPAILFGLALASFFPLANFIDDMLRTLRPIAPPDSSVPREQLRRLSNADSSGILTVGIVGADLEQLSGRRCNHR